MMCLFQDVAALFGQELALSMILWIFFTEIKWFFPRCGVVLFKDKVKWLFPRCGGFFGNEMALSEMGWLTRWLFPRCGGFFGDEMALPDMWWLTRWLFPRCVGSFWKWLFQDIVSRW